MLLICALRSICASASSAAAAPPRPCHLRAPVIRLRSAGNDRERAMTSIAGMADGDAWLRARRDGDRLVLTAGGRWVIAAAVSLDRQLRALDGTGAREVVIDLAAVT